VKDKIFWYIPFGFKLYKNFINAFLDNKYEKVIFAKIILQSNYISVKKVFILNTTKKKRRRGIKIA